MDFFQDTGGRLLILLVTTPLWWPVMRALWDEVNWMLRDEGGVFGPIPPERERERLLRPVPKAEDPLVEEPIITPEQRAQGGQPGWTREAKEEEEPRGFARSGKVKQPTRFR